MIFGYARVSTQSQDLARQLDLLNSYGCEEILTEKITGTKIDRPELTRLKNDKIRSGDTVIIESFSRLGRSTKDLIELVEWFEKKEVKLISLKENFDTTTPQGKLMLTVFHAFSQFERDLIVQRTKEGLESARARGRKGGRPKKNPKNIDTALKMYYSKQFSIKQIYEATKVPATTLYRYKALHEPVIESAAEKETKIEMWLGVENGSKFTRGKSNVRTSIEDYLGRYYRMEKVHPQSQDYEFYLTYTTLDDVNNTIDEIIDFMIDEANSRNCALEYIITCKELDLQWD